MSTIISASDGASFDLDSVAQTLAYDGSNKLTSITVVYRNNTYKQTYTYTAGNLTSISQWTLQ